MAKRVILELRVPVGVRMTASEVVTGLDLPGFKIDRKYKPVVTTPPPEMAKELTASREQVLLVRGEIDEDKETEIRALPNVLAVWSDPQLHPTEAGIDCDDEVAKGTLADVARYLRCDRLWATGVTGRGVTIAICDTGVDQAKVPAVTGGWSPDSGAPPGTDGNGHGTMCATDALGVCPDARIMDIGVLKGGGDSGVFGVLSDAITAFDWALGQYRINGQPQILSNSWAVYQQASGPDYATNINHPFNRKVAELVDAGICVLFCAGNCGSVCPDNRCGPDTGPGKSIWGANGHPKVITVAAANLLDEWAGYSSEGPAVFDFKKPDICAPTHFQGYTACDNGTSAATPVCAGVAGLLRSADDTLKPDRIKEALQNTAKNLLGAGWDARSGYGMIQAESAYDYLFADKSLSEQTVWVHGSSTREEYSDRLKSSRCAGFYAMYEGLPATANRFHAAIPTPAVIDGKRYRLDSVMLVFITDPDVNVTSVSVYEGRDRIQSYTGLALTGEHLFERFDVSKEQIVQRGIAVSVEVSFGSASGAHRVGIISVGGHFREAAGA